MPLVCVKITEYVPTNDMSRSVENSQSEEILKHALSLNPADHRISESLAGTYRDSGRVELAIDIYMDLIARFPEQSSYVIGLGNCYEVQGNITEAANYYIKAANIEPQSAEYLYGLSELLIGIDEVPQAVKVIDAVPYNPQLVRDILIRISIGSYYNDILTVELLYEALLSLQPNNPEFYVAYAGFLMNQGENEKSFEQFRQFLNCGEDAITQLLDYAQECSDRADTQLAIFVYEGVVRHAPDNYIANYNLGNSYQKIADFGRATDRFVKAIELNPQLGGAYNNLANIYRSQGHSQKALDLFDKALKIPSVDTDLILSNRGAVYSNIGDMDAALTCYREAMKINPNNEDVYSNFLYGINYLDSLNEGEIFEYHNSWSDQFLINENLPRKSIVEAKGRAIRVGFVSGDFRTHSVAYFFCSLLRGVDKRRMHIYCYSTNEREDEVTEQIKSLIVGWRHISHLSDQDATDLIKTDSLDILVDLSGHTSGRRQSLFTLRPAPVQATWLGYPNTTGNRFIDYRITDDVADPIGVADSLHVEELIRLPTGFLCYQGDASLPVSDVPPMTVSNKITFGSFNNITKINNTVIRLWSRLLNEIEHSQLLIKSLVFEDASASNKFLEKFKRYGVDQDQLILIKYAPDYQGHMALYNSVDVALDTFPYNGTTTTCEALWMGVPVLTLSHVSHRGRVSKSILSRVGLDDFSADSEQDYIDRARALINSPSSLIDLKRQLRSRMLDSVLTSSSQHAREMDNAFRHMMTLSLQRERT